MDGPKCLLNDTEEPVKKEPLDHDRVLMKYALSLVV